MNRYIAAIYAISISHDGHALTQEQKDKLVDRIQPLCDEINRLEAIVDDPFIRGYLEAKRTGTSITLTVSEKP